MSLWIRLCNHTYIPVSVVSTSHAMMTIWSCSMLMKVFTLHGDLHLYVDDARKRMVGHSIGNCLE